VVLVVGVVVEEVVVGPTIEVVHLVDLVVVAVVVVVVMEEAAVAAVVATEVNDEDQDRDLMTVVLAVEEEEEAAEVADLDQDPEVDPEIDLVVVIQIVAVPAHDPALLPSQETSVRHLPEIEGREVVPTSPDQSPSRDLSPERDRDPQWRTVKTTVANEVTATTSYLDGLAC